MPVIVIFDNRTGSFDDLPSDVLQNATRFRFSMQNFFPEYDSSVLQALTPDIWNLLENHAKKKPGKTFNKGKTEEIALRLGYQIVSDVIDSFPELFRRLIDLHRRSDGLPKQLNRLREKGKRVALIVLDGLSMVGWFSISAALKSQMKQNAQVAWHHHFDSLAKDEFSPFPKPLADGGI